MAPESSPRRPVDIQSLSRSCHEVLILATLRSGPHHGYQLALELEERSHGAFQFKHGTLYPILHRLEGEGLIRGDWLDETSRRKRKRYEITPQGRRWLEEETMAWREFSQRFFHVLEEVVT